MEIEYLTKLWNVYIHSSQTYAEIISTEQIFHFYIIQNASPSITLVDNHFLAKQLS